MNDDYVKVSVDGLLSDTQKTNLRKGGVALSTSNSLFGGEAVTEIIAVISAPYVLVHLKEVVIELIKNRRKLRIKTKDFEFDDVSEAQIPFLIECLQKKIANPDELAPPSSGKSAAKKPRNKAL